MTVYIIGPAFPLRGGLSDFDMRLAKELEYQGHEVQIISFKLLYPNFLFPGKTQYVAPDTPSPKLTIQTLINTVNPFNWIKIGRKIKKERPDIIITRYWTPFLSPSLGSIHRFVRRNKHTRIIALTDNVIPHEKHLGDSALTSYFVRSVHQFLCMSQDVQNDLKKFTNRPILTIPHPMYDVYGQLIDKHTAKTELGLQKDDKTVLFFGFIRKYKGLDLLLEAMSMPQVRKHNIKLIIAGEYYIDPQPYRELIEKLQLTQHLVQQTDFIPSHRIHRYFSAADVVVLPYKEATQSGVTQIGFYFNKPMIVTNVGALPETIRHQEYGLIAEPNAQSIAQSIAQYFEQQLEQPFTEAIQVERKKYEWKHFVNTVLANNKP